MPCFATEDSGDMRLRRYEWEFFPFLLARRHRTSKRHRHKAGMSSTPIPAKSSPCFG